MTFVSQRSAVWPLYTMMDKGCSPGERKTRQRSPDVRGNSYLPRRTYIPPAKAMDHRDGFRRTAPVTHNNPAESKTSEERIAVRQAASEGLRSKLRTNAGGAEGHDYGRRVTFQDELPQRNSSSVHPAYRRSPRPLSGRASDMTPIDHKVEGYGGVTSTIECLPDQLRISKVRPIPSPKQRIEELQRENGHLRRELSYYKDTRKVLMKSFHSIHESHQALHETLAEASQISSRRYFLYCLGPSATPNRCPRWEM